MEISKYLVITPSSKKYGKPTVKLIDKTKGNTIASNAVVLKLNLDLPDALFQKPQLEAKIRVNPDQVSKPIIEPSVIQNIKEVLKQHSGIDLTISIIEDANV